MKHLRLDEKGVGGNEQILPENTLMKKQSCIMEAKILCGKASVG
jgi:hypothetical protein